MTTIANPMKIPPGIPEATNIGMDELKPLIIE